MRRCPIPNCKYNENAIAADLHQMKRHIRWGHNCEELVKAGIFYDIISPEEHYHNFDSLADRLTQLPVVSSKSNP